MTERASLLRSQERSEKAVTRPSARSDWSAVSGVEVRSGLWQSAFVGLHGLAVLGGLSVGHEAALFSAAYLKAAFDA